MKFVWAGDRQEYNSRRIFTLKNTKHADKLVLGAVDFYQVFINGEFCSFGPERTAGGYCKLREIKLDNAEEITIKVNGQNFNCYACDLQLPFFGAELYKGEQLLYDSSDFSCENDLARKTRTVRFSGQRGCVERYDFTDKKTERLQVYEVDAPIILKGNEDTADYQKIGFDFIKESIFCGFDKVQFPEWTTRDKYKNLYVEDFTVDGDFLPRVNGLNAYDFALKEEKSGFIELTVTAQEKTDVFVTFEELLIDGKWIFRRSACNDLVSFTVNRGQTKYLTTEPYTLKLLKVLSDKKITVTPKLVLLENKNVGGIYVHGNEKIQAVVQAAKNTFRQNAVDIFTDCPGRERAGWLCDSLFLAQAERLFTGENKIEKSFLENIIIAQTPELPEKMIPKCFPSEHPIGHYIPTWAMWFIIEIEDYYRRTGDRELVDKAKKKIYDVIEFFNPFINSDGLLEDLQGWVFIEWSACNKAEYVAGVNYPANMLFAYSLKKVAELYDDGALVERANKILNTVFEQSFNGEFFIDNALRINGKLIRQETHLTETCQYYALITGLCPSEEFKKKMINEFGPMRKDAYPDVDRSNMIVGNLLRFFYLIEHGEKERALKESVEHFYSMAKITGTLWEHNKPTASCNHGFASVAAVIIAKCLTGYQTVENRKEKLIGEDLSEKYGVTVEYKY